LSSSSAGWRDEKKQGKTMHKCISIAGIFLFAALLFVQPSKADNFDTYTFISGPTKITFTVPQTLTPSSVTWNGNIYLTNITGTYDGSAYTFATVQLGAAGYLNATNYAATGSITKSVAFLSPGLFTWNSDGTVTLNAGVFNLGKGSLTVVDPPGASTETVGTPEPASLILLGFGGLALGALRRRRVN
jgi:hypothetical protein